MAVGFRLGRKFILLGAWSVHNTLSKKTDDQSYNLGWPSAFLLPRTGYPSVQIMYLWVVTLEIAGFLLALPTRIERATHGLGNRYSY